MLPFVLNGVLSLGDIRNVEKLCDRIATQALGARVAMTATTNGQLAGSLSPHKSGLSEHDREDLVAYLIAQTWELWLRYDEEHPGGAKFSTFAIPQLRMRVLDWWRRKLGRQRPGRATKDNPGEWGVLSTGELDEHEFERSLGARGGDDPAARVSDLDGILRAGGGQARRDAVARSRAAVVGAARDDHRAA